MRTRVVSHVAALGAAVICCGVVRAEAPRPHIVVLLADDLGWADVGYRGSDIRTPAIDALAREGRRLEQFYVQPVCSPTRASLMTGRYPIRYGLQVGVIWPWATYGMPLEERTLAEALAAAGYVTAMVGKWHLGLVEPAYLPQHRGFASHYGLYTGSIDYFEHTRLGGLDWHRDGAPVRERGYSTALLGEEAARIVARHDPAHPLFLYVAFNAPHTPLQAPDRYFAHYDDISDDNRRTYAAMVSALDEAVGRILAALDRRGMRENTLVFFASDNGGHERWGADNGHLRGGKGLHYEGGVRTPAVVRWPARIPAGSTTQGLMHVVDLYPTLLHLAGASLDQPLPLDGEDAWAVLAGDGAGRAEVLINAEPRRGAIRRGRWKLVQEPMGARGKKKPPAFALFDLALDPSETLDRAAAEPQVFQSLLERLEQFRAAAVPPRETGLAGNMPEGFDPPRVWGGR
jgi:arylsulfatase A-like enzyme